VLVLERDPLEPAPDVEAAAAAAFRSAAPQIVRPHNLMARCRELLIQRLPDVYDGLLAAGVAEAPLWMQRRAGLALRRAAPRLMPRNSPATCAVPRRAATVRFAGPRPA
jgi:hypothetical protein